MTKRRGRSRADASGVAVGLRVLRVELGPRAYEIRIGPGLLERVGERLRALGLASRAIVVTDSNVRALLADRVERSLGDAGIPHSTIAVPPGERTKSAGALVRLWDAMLDAGIDRRTAVVALGGGVVGDLAGFAAATILRGVPYLQVPTTLLAQVDSSVGGKTAIDRPRGKNLVGAFWQPVGVEIDPLALATLPDRELRSGLAEVVKAGVIRSRELFELVEARAEDLLRRGPDPLARAVELACRVKAAVVGRDERDESGERAVLNFGHTIGHALESAAGLGTLLHGEAVSIGMVAAGRLALRFGGWSEKDQARLEALLRRLGLPTDAEGLGVGEPAVMRHLRADKKALGGALRFVLPERIGRARLREEPVPEALVRETLASLGIRGRPAGGT